MYQLECHAFFFRLICHSIAVFDKSRHTLNRSNNAIFALIGAIFEPFLNNFNPMPVSGLYRKIFNQKSSSAMRLVPFLFLFVFVLTSACNQQAPEQPAVPRDPNQAVPDTSASASVPRENLWKNRGCELVTDSDMQQLFGVEPSRDVLNSRTLPDQAFCLRTWNKIDWKERENSNEKEGSSWLDPQNSLVVQVFGYTTNEHAKQQIGMLKRDRRNTYEEDVAGTGDEAIWSTNTVTLLVRKGHMVLSIALNHVDNPHDNLAKAKEVAAVALKKM